MPGGRLQAASDATRTEAVAVVEGEGCSGARQRLDKPFQEDRQQPIP
jgi:hypothetical protein